MNPPFVKKFDFRGIYGEDILDADAFYLGLALFKTFSLKKVLVGWDTRVSSKNLAESFIASLEGKDVDINILDKCPIDYVTASANAFDFDLSIMFTGSHNPWTWTGLLIHKKGGDSLQGEEVKEVIKNYEEVKVEPYEAREIDIASYKSFYEEIEKVYIEKLKSIIPFEKIKELKVLIDIGDGSGSRSLSLVEKYLPQVKFARLNDRNIYDENSPHIADPSNIENMNQLTEQVMVGSYDCGFAFDSDADRVLAIDEKGNYVNGSCLGSIHVEVFSERALSDSDFGYAVDCGPSMKNCISDLNKKGLSIFSTPIPVGRSLVRKLIADGQIDFGVENVGHFYSSDFFMTDSGTFSMLVTLFWITLNGQLSHVFEKYPDGARDQIFSEVLTDEEEGKLISEINKEFEKYEIKKIEQDGIRCEFIQDGKLVTWYTIRKSGYEAISKTYYGSLNAQDYNFLKEKFAILKKI